MKVRMHVPTICAVILAVIIALCNSTVFLYGIFFTTPGTIFMGTIHYFEDYFFYLNHFFQGAHGAWLTVNRYTPEHTVPSIIYWCNVLLGKIGGLFGLSPVYSYNISLILLVVCALIVSYYFLQSILKKPSWALFAFIIGTTATSLINYVATKEGTMIFWPFQIWRTPHFMFDRLGGATHQIMQTLLAYLFFLSLSIKTDTKKKQLFLFFAPVIILSVLTTVNPIQSTFYIGELWAAFVLYSVIHYSVPSRFRLFRLLTLTVTTGVGFALMFTALNQPPHIQSKAWEATQDSYTVLPFLFLSIGPILPLAVIGFITKFKQLAIVELFGALTIITGYILFMSRIPQTFGFSNLRTLFPASYVFWGLFAFYGIQWIAGFIRIFIKIPAEILIGLTIVLFVGISAPTIIWEIEQKIPKSSLRTDPMMFLPVKVAEGYAFLQKQKPYDAIAVGNPSSHMDLLIPALSGHTTFSGHMLATIDNAKKSHEAYRFFNVSISRESARQWMMENKISYVILTEYDGSRVYFEKQYDFLKKLYENSDVAVYRL